MPATSKAQRRFMAICEHHPEKAKGKCPKMSKEEMHKFASTKEKGLPMHNKAGNTEYLVGQGSTPETTDTDGLAGIKANLKPMSPVLPMTMIPGSDHSQVTETPVNVGNKTPNKY
jgi:hypothetical protein